MKAFNTVQVLPIAFTLTLSLLALPALLACPNAQLKAAEPTAVGAEVAAGDREKEIREQAALFAKYFSSGQADSIAELCTEDCTLTDAQGEKFVGREAIRKLYQRCFHDFGVNPVTLNIDTLTFPAVDVCIEDGSLFVSNVNTANRYTVVHEKRKGAWKMFRITESPYNPEPSEALKELNWLSGHWVIKDGTKLTALDIHPIANGNFLLMKFTKTDGEKVLADDLQLIGWSFRTRDIVSWHFGVDGGFGFGHWRPTGSSWTIETKGVRRDGSETFANNHMERVDANHFRWSSTDRRAGGEQLPDLPAVEATRE